MWLVILYIYIYYICNKTVKTETRFLHPSLKYCKITTSVQYIISFVNVSKSFSRLCSKEFYKFHSKYELFFQDQILAYMPSYRLVPAPGTHFEMAYTALKIEITKIWEFWNSLVLNTITYWRWSKTGILSTFYVLIFNGWKLKASHPTILIFMYWTRG